MEASGGSHLKTLVRLRIHTGGKGKTYINAGLRESWSENGRDNNQDRFYDTESRNQKAVAADRKLPGTSPSTIADAIVPMTISGPNAEGDEDHFLVLRTYQFSPTSYRHPCQSQPRIQPTTPQRHLKLSLLAARNTLRRMSLSGRHCAAGLKNIPTRLFMS